MNDTYPQLVLAILKGQEEIIGPIAWQQAASVDGLSITPDHKVTIHGDSKQTIDSLVYKFRDFFGQAAIEVCKDAVQKSSLSLAPDDLPATLK